MKVFFSEFDPDYSRYRYPYVVWAAPEGEETPADLYEAGFHPASPQLDRFTLCRHLRLRLPGFEPSSENRRILRQGGGLKIEVVERSAYAVTDAKRGEWLRFAEERFGPGIMTPARLDGLLTGRVISHLLVCREQESGREVGAVLMYLQPPRMAHYYYAFYELGHPVRSLGLHLMTAAVMHFRDAGFDWIYLGTCYSARALYKTQFRGIEFFNGLEWSADLEELKFLLERDARGRHLLEEPTFLEPRGGWDGIRARGGSPWSPRRA